MSQAGIWQSAVSYLMHFKIKSLKLTIKLEGKRPKILIMDSHGLYILGIKSQSLVHLVLI